MAWTDLSSAFVFGSKLTSAQMQNLRDNITALANGDAGAPEIQTAALADSLITQAKMANNAGDVRKTNPGTTGAYYEVLDSGGTWDRCSENFDDT